MLVPLTDDQKLHLSLLKEIDVNVAKEFCRIAVDFITNGINTKKYQLAAVKLELDYDNVRQCVEAIMFVLSEASKLELSEDDFNVTVLNIGLDEDFNSCLTTFYVSNCDAIRAHLKKLSLEIPHYTDLEWRFDVKVSSRMLKYQTTPEIILRLHTENGCEKTTHMFQTDPVNLLHLTEQLEEALMEARTSHCRKIARTT